MGFNDEYWRKNYSELSEMDCIFNAKEHCRYLKASFALEYIDVSSIIDFGAGYGHLFSQMIKTFKPYRASAVEPSQKAFDRLKKKKLKLGNMKLSLYQEDLASFVKSEKCKEHDLGICTSVLQYLTESELKVALKHMAKNVKYLYLTVPIDLELERQKIEYDFVDEYAYKRSHKFYYEILKKDFSFVGNRILESKYYFNEMNSPFSELLFRF